MNKICETCDTKNRLKLCRGRDGDFKYCYRPVGSTSCITSDSIIPFNELSELYPFLESKYDNFLDLESLELGNNEDFYEGHIGMLTGYSCDRKHLYPCGWIIK